MSYDKLDKEIISQITTRILEVCQDKKIKAAYLYKNGVGAQQTIYDVFNGKQKPGIDIAVRFLKLFPDVDGDWLMTGKGEKYKTGNFGLSAKNIVDNSKLERKDEGVSIRENEKSEKHYKEMLEEKNSRIADFQSQIETLKEQNKTLLSVIDILKNRNP